MNKKTLFLGVSLVAVAIVSTFGYYTTVQAQKKEIVEYLTQRFQAKKIPVTNIEVVELDPLQLQIVVQSVGDYITPEDSINLHKVDREVFIVARKNDYIIERYIRVLQDGQGKQLYKLDQGAAEIQQVFTNQDSSGVSDNDVKKILSEKIDSFAKELHFQNTNIKLDISSDEGVRALELEFATPSLDEAYYVFGFLQSKLISPLDGLIAEVNAQGGQIVMCTYKIIDDDNNILFFYFFDYQLQRGTWSSANTFRVDLGEGGPPP